MRIVIDLQGAQTESRFRGIGRYSLSLALAMARNAGKHELWLALNGAFPESIPDIRRDFEGLIPQEHIRVFDVPTPVAEHNPANAWRVRAAEKIREHFLEQLNPDVVHIASLFENPVENAVTSVGTFIQDENTAVTLYDLIPLLNEAVYLPSRIHKDWYYGKIASLKNAALSLAISDYSRSEAIEVLQLPQDRVVNISAAAEDRFHPITLSEEAINRLRSRYDIERKMVLYAPGGFDVRKNFDGLLQAYSLLSSGLRADHQLVIVSKIGDSDIASLRRLRKRAGLAVDELVLTGYVTDDDLVMLYNLATLFVYPSKHEGFGLPALEAMTCGAPTIGSNASSIPEVIGWDEALFDPADANEISKAMYRGLTDEPFYQSLREHALVQARKFSWGESARRAIRAFEALHERRLETCHKKTGGFHALIESIADISLTVQATEKDLRMTAVSIATNETEPNRQQLLVDVSTLVERDAGTGIQRVVRSILLQLLHAPPAGYIVEPVFGSVEGFFRYARNFKNRFLGRTAGDGRDTPIEFKRGDIFLGLDLSAHLFPKFTPVLEKMSVCGVSLFFYVHDLIPINSPECCDPVMPTVFRGWLDAITKYANGLICISAATANDVSDWMKAHDPKLLDHVDIAVVHNGADIDDSVPSIGLPENASPVLDAIKAVPSFLMVGTIEPRKNHAQALAAFEELWTGGVDANLVIVGRQGWLVESLADKLRGHAELGKRLFWLEGISDEYLKKIYDAGACLIAASMREGFGLPLIEAAQQKLPLIVRDIPVFREVAGDHAFYFKGSEPAALAHAIKAWLELLKSDLHPKSDNLPWLTWKESAERLKRLLFDSMPE